MWVNQAKLPSEYQEVEYIQSSGTQYIDTGLFASNNIQVETKIEVTTTDQDIPIFGSFMGGSGTDGLGGYYHVTPYNSKFYYGLNGSEGNAGSYSATLGTQYTIVFNNSNNKLVVNNSEIATTTGTAGYTGTTLGISRRGQGGSARYGKFKYFYFRMYDKTQSKYVRDFVPCYRKSDNVIGLYDLVNNQFYTNSGTGTFTKGNDVNMVEKQVYPDKMPGYQEVEYIEFPVGNSGNSAAFIVTNIVPNNNLQIETKIGVTTTEQNHPIFGIFTPTEAQQNNAGYPQLTPYQNSFYYGYGGTEYHAGSYSATVGNQYTIVYNDTNSKIVVNNTSIATLGSATQPSWGGTISIGVRGSLNWGRYGQYKYFYFRIYNKTTQQYVGEFVPCYRKSDNVVGMYDTVTKQFYTKYITSSPYDFIKGPDVN